MKNQKTKKTSEYVRIMYASRRMCKLQKVLQQMWLDFHHEILAHVSVYKYKDEKENIPIGITVMLVLNPAIMCSECLLSVWKKRLKAQKYEFGVCKEHPKVHFHIDFDN